MMGRAIMTHRGKSYALSHDPIFFGEMPLLVCLDRARAHGMEHARFPEQLADIVQIVVRQSGTLWNKGEII